MADAHGSGPCVRKDVGVQLPPRPHRYWASICGDPGFEAAQAVNSNVTTSDKPIEDPDFVPGCAIIVRVRWGWGFGALSRWSVVLITLILSAQLTASVAAWTGWGPPFVTGGILMCLVARPMTGVRILPNGDVLFVNGLRRRSVPVGELTRIYRRRRRIWRAQSITFESAATRPVRLLPQMQGLAECVVTLHQLNPGIEVSGP
jgi:hypothetical protein